MKISDVNLRPVTIFEAYKTIEDILVVLVETQGIAIERGAKIIEMNEEKLAAFRDHVMLHDQ